MNIYEMLINVQSREDFLAFMDALRKDYCKNIKEWYNQDLSSYLESVSSWVEHMDGYYQNMNLPLPSNIDWNFIAVLFYVGKIYE